MSWIKGNTATYPASLHLWENLVLNLHVFFEFAAVAGVLEDGVDRVLRSAVVNFWPVIQVLFEAIPELVGLVGLLYLRR